MIALFLLIAFGLQAQESYTKDDVRAMFPVNVKNLWINKLSGWLDGKHTVDMIIGTDGFSCRGIYTMRSSGETFFFEGDDVSHELKLVEMTQDGKTTGFIFGHYDGEKMSGMWMNVAKNQQLALNLSLVSDFDTQTGYSCNTYQWHGIFSGKVNDQQVKIRISKSEDAFLVKSYGDSMIFKDIIPAKNDKIEFLAPEIRPPVLVDYHLKIDTSDLSKLVLMRYSGGHYEIGPTLKSDGNISFECYEYADYHSRLVVQKPVTSSKKFNQWVESQMLNWMKNNIHQLGNIKKDNIATRDRWIQYADGWVEISLFSGDLVSGTIYLQSSLNPQTKKIPFIYDLKWNKEVKLQDFFVKDFDSKEYFSQEIPKRKKEIVCKHEMLKWLGKQEFKYPVLKDNGISFSTDFNGIYGEKEILFAYKDLEPHFKNRNLLKEFLF